MALGYVKKIVLDSRHSLYVEDIHGDMWVIPKDATQPAKPVVHVCNCRDPWAGRH